MTKQELTATCAKIMCVLDRLEDPELRASFTEAILRHDDLEKLKVYVDIFYRYTEQK